MLQQVSADPRQQQMGKHLVWYAEQFYFTAVVAFLTVPIPLPDRDDPPPSSSQEKWYLNAIQQSRQHGTTGHGFTPALNNSALMLQMPVAFPPLNFPTASLTSSMEGAVWSMGGSASSICNPAVWSCPLGGSTVNSCSKYSTKQAFSPSAFNMRQPSAVQIALTQDVDLE